MGGTGSTHGTDKMKKHEMGEACSTHERYEIMKCRMVRHVGHVREIKTKEKKHMTAWAGFIWLKLYASD